MQSVTFVDGHGARHVRRASRNVQSVTFADGHCARHVGRASRNAQDNLGRHVHVDGLVGVNGLLLGKCDDKGTLWPIPLKLPLVNMSASWFLCQLV